jgi:hypothetical protein
MTSASKSMPNPDHFGRRNWPWPGHPGSQLALWHGLYQKIRELRDGPYKEDPDALWQSLEALTYHLRDLGEQLDNLWQARREENRRARDSVPVDPPA